MAEQRPQWPWLTVFVDSAARSPEGRAWPEHEQTGPCYPAQVRGPFNSHQLDRRGDNQRIAAQVTVWMADVDVGPKRAERGAEEHGLPEVARLRAVRLLLVDPDRLVIVQQRPPRRHVVVGQSAD